MESLESDDPMPIAFKTTKGELVVALHPRDEHYETVKTHTLNPWEWLVNKGENGFCVMTNEELQSLTAVVL